MTAARILVVDDEPNIRDLLITSLRFAGFQVRAVSNIVERRNRGAWKLREAVEALNATALRLIEHV